MATVLELPALRHWMVRCECIWNHLVYMPDEFVALIVHVLLPHLPELLYLLKITLLHWQHRKAGHFFDPAQLHVQEAYCFRWDVLSRSLAVLEQWYGLYQTQLAQAGTKVYKCHPILVQLLE